MALCGDLPPLPHDSSSLAGIFCFSVLTHIPPQRHADWYAEIHRVLRPGARAYITVHGDENIRTGKTFTEEERQAYAETGWSWSERPGHYKHAATVSRAFTVEALGSGFEIEAYDELGYLDGFDPPAPTLAGFARPISSAVRANRPSAPR